MDFWDKAKQTFESARHSAQEAFDGAVKSVSNSIQNNAKLVIGAGAALAGVGTYEGLTKYFNQPEEMAAQCQHIQNNGGTTLGDTVRVVGFGATPISESIVTKIEPGGDTQTVYASHTSQTTDSGYEDTPTYIKIKYTALGGSSESCTIHDPVTGKISIATGGIQRIYTNGMNNINGTVTATSATPSTSTGTPATTNGSSGKGRQPAGNTLRPG